MMILVRSEPLFVGETADGAADGVSEVVLEVRLWREVDPSADGDFRFVAHVVVGRAAGLTYECEALTGCDDEVVLFGTVFWSDQEQAGGTVVNEMAEKARPVYDCLVDNSFAVPRNGFGQPVPDVVDLLQ